MILFRWRAVERIDFLVSLVALGGAVLTSVILLVGEACGHSYGWRGADATGCVAWALLSPDLLFIFVILLLATMAGVGAWTHRLDLVVAAGITTTLLAQAIGRVGPLLLGVGLVQIGAAILGYATIPWRQGRSSEVG